MGPAVLVDALKLVKTPKAKYFTNRDVHEVLFLLFRKMQDTLAEFLNTNQKQHCVGIGGAFAKVLFKGFEQIAPLIVAAVYKRVYGG